MRDVGAQVSCSTAVRVAVAAGWAVLSGCGTPEPSALEQRSKAVAEAPPRRDPVPEKRAPTEAAPAQPIESTPPPQGAEFVELKLALAEGTEYRTTTVGVIEFPMVGKPTGYAREERLRLKDCTGEGHERRCSLHHRYTNFDAEPPTGPILKTDEARVAPLATRHRITATGFREGETEVTGPDEFASTEAAKSLAQVHRFYCIRLPSEPVSVGAKWRHTCRTFTGGVVATRRVVWELVKLSDDPVSGKRAELRAVGEYEALHKLTVRKGTVESVLYFFVDKGEPHILREKIRTPLTEQKRSFTNRTINVQFAKVTRKGKTEAFVRTDGQALEKQPMRSPQATDRRKREPPVNKALQ